MGWVRAQTGRTRRTREGSVHPSTVRRIRGLLGQPSSGAIGRVTAFCYDGGMALTEFQRKHPHRPIGGRNYQTYLERSFEQADEADVAYWWSVGAVPQALAHDERAASFMRAALHGLVRLPPSQANKEWGRLWEAGAGKMTAFHGLWLGWMAAHPPSAAFLMERGVSPHEVFETRYVAGRDQRVSACVNELLNLLRAATETHRPHTRDAIEGAWEHWETLNRAPGWLPEQQAYALRALTSTALHASPNHPDQPRWARLRDELVASCPDPWADTQTISGDVQTSAGLAGVWLSALPAKPAPAHERAAQETKDAQWVAWGQALLRHPPSEPRSSRGLPGELVIGRAHHPLLTPFLAPLAEQGLHPWAVVKPDARRASWKNQASSEEARTLLDAMTEDPQAVRAQRSLALRPEWWAALEETSRRIAPSAAWQNAALQVWLKRTLHAAEDWGDAKPGETGFVLGGWNQRGAPASEAGTAWVKHWRTWAALGRWDENGIPEEVIDGLRSLAGTLASLPVSVLAALVPLWQQWGAFPSLLVPKDPSPRWKGSPADAPVFPEQDPNVKRSHEWLLWARLVETPELHATAASLLPEVPGLLHAAAVLACEPSCGAESFVARLAVRDPEWWAQRGSVLLDTVLRRSQTETALMLLHLDVPLPADWKGWHAGVRGHSSFTTGSALFSETCFWLTLAHRMHSKGLAWEAGSSASCPLKAVIDHWDARVGSSAVKGLIAAGADPFAVEPPERPDHTPNAALWAAIRAERVLGQAVEEPAGSRRRLRM